MFWLLLIWLVFIFLGLTLALRNLRLAMQSEEFKTIEEFKKELREEIKKALQEEMKKKLLGGERGG